MSKFKKMKIVPFNDNDKQQKTLNEILNILKLSTTPYLKKASNLDSEIQKVLNTNLNDYQKVKLYSNTLIKFLKAKEKYEDINNQAVQSIVASQALSTPINVSKKRKRPPKKRKVKKIKFHKVKKESPSLSETDDEREENILPKSFNKVLQLPESININPPAKSQKKSPVKTKVSNQKIDEEEKLKKFDEELALLTQQAFNPFQSKSKVKRSPAKQVQRKERSTKTTAREKTKEVLKYEEGNKPSWEDY